MEDIDDLDQSPIGYEDEEAMSEGSRNSSSEEQEMFDSETFKGSFLQEMEKLCKPLKFERILHNIYTHQQQTSEENFLAFIQKEQQQSKFTFDLQQTTNEYIIDFEQNEELPCTCQCHQQHKNCRQKSRQSINNHKDLNKINSVKEIVIVHHAQFPEKQKKQKEGEKNWTSLSLKQYKMRIKKKLQEKR